MRKPLNLLFSLLFAVSILSCGGEGGVSTQTGTTGKTKVTISLGETKTVSSGSLISTSSIPAAIASVAFTISAPDMATIVRVIAVSGSSSISETFDVQIGYNRHFLVEAMDAESNILFRGSTYADLIGESVELTIAMISVEEIAPLFSGLTAIDSVTTTSMLLSWLPATDNVTPTDRIQYLIYVSTTPGGQNFTAPNFVTAKGASSYTLTGLNPDTTYYIVVRAMDERGNVDVNNTEKSATTLLPPDETPPEFGGIVSAAALSETEISLSWDPASDDRTSPADITYLIYMSTESQGQNLAIPSFMTTGMTSHTVTGLAPGTTYYFIVRAKDEADNIDTNTIEKSATTLLLPFIDLSPDYIYDICGDGCMVFDVENLGTMEAVNIEVYAINGYFGAPTGCQYFSIPIIPANDYVTLDTYLSLYMDYYIIADPNNTILESDKSNNTSCSGTFCTSPPIWPGDFGGCFF